MGNCPTLDSNPFPRSRPLPLCTSSSQVGAETLPAATAMQLHYYGSLFLLGRMTLLSASSSAATAGDSPIEEVESALTDRYQTTVPQPVRRALGLRKRDRIRYAFRANGEVVLQRACPEPADDDPALAPFLLLLEQDIAAHPERLQPISADLAGRLQELVGGVAVDLDGPPPEDDDGMSNLPSKPIV